MPLKCSERHKLKKRKKKDTLNITTILCVLLYSPPLTVSKRKTQNVPENPSEAPGEMSDDLLLMVISSVKHTNHSFGVCVLNRVCVNGMKLS